MQHPVNARCSNLARGCAFQPGTSYAIFLMHVPCNGLLCSLLPVKRATILAYVTTSGDQHFSDHSTRYGSSLQPHQAVLDFCQSRSCVSAVWPQKKAIMQMRAANELACHARQRARHTFKCCCLCSLRSSCMDANRKALHLIVLLKAWAEPLPSPAMTYDRKPCDFSFIGAFKLSKVCRCVQSTQTHNILASHDSPYAFADDIEHAPEWEIDPRDAMARHSPLSSISISNTSIHHRPGQAPPRAAHPTRR